MKFPSLYLGCINQLKCIKFTEDRHPHLLQNPKTSPVHMCKNNREQALVIITYSLPPQPYCFFLEYNIFISYLLCEKIGNYFLLLRFLRGSFVYVSGGKVGLLSNMLNKSAFAQDGADHANGLPHRLFHKFISAPEALLAPCFCYFDFPLCMERINHFCSLCNITLHM